MLHEIKMTGAKCDHCKKDWYDDHNGWCCMSDDSSMETVLMEEGWHKGDESCNEGKDWEHYCPDCYSYDDDDNFILDSSRKDKYKAQSEY